MYLVLKSKCVLDNYFPLTFAHRESMVPAFFSKEDVNNIFHTGRYIHFLHTICESKPDLTPSRKVLKDLRNSGGLYRKHGYFKQVNFLIIYIIFF